MTVDSRVMIWAIPFTHECRVDAGTMTRRSRDGERRTGAAWITMGDSARAFLRTLGRLEPVFRRPNRRRSFVFIAAVRGSPLAWMRLKAERRSLLCITRRIANFRALEALRRR
jgi:hypothetical protein